MTVVDRDPRTVGYQLAAIVRVKPAPLQDPRTRRRDSRDQRMHRITGEDCFFLKIHLGSINDLSRLLDRFLLYGKTTTSIINASQSLDANRP